MKGADCMSLLDSIKKGLFDQEDDYEDQYIDAVSYTHLTLPTT